MEFDRMEFDRMVFIAHWFRNMDVSEKLHEVLILKNDDFDQSDVQEMEAVATLWDILNNHVPTIEFITDIHEIVVKCVVETKHDISNVFNRAEITENDEEALSSRVKKTERKVSFILAGFIKAALESSLCKWKALRPGAMEMLKEVLRTNLQLIHSVPAAGNENTNMQKKQQLTKNFLTEISTCVWYSVLFELEESFQINDFIDIFRELAMADIFDQDWYLMGPWNDVLEEFSARHGFEIQRVPQIDDILQLRTVELRGQL